MPSIITIGRMFTLLLLLTLLTPISSLAKDHAVTILHFNDFHGQLASIKERGKETKDGGIARLAGTIHAIRNAEPDRTVLLLFAGDLLQGTMLSSLHHGKPDIEIFNSLGIDAAVLGNHELDYGQDNLKRLITLGNFPVLAANTDIPGLRPLLKSTTAIQGKGGLRIGVIGLTTQELVTSTHPRNTEGVTMAEPLAVARGYLRDIRAESDLVILISHLGLAGDRRMARELGGLDLIVGGHNHFAFEQPKRENGVLIVQAGERGRALGRLDLKVTENGVQLESYRLIPINESSPVDEKIAARVKELSAAVSKAMDQVVGQNLNPMSANREIIRRIESNLGSFTADLGRKLTGADVVLFNGGTFRDSIEAGPVTLGKIYRVFPFGNEVVTGTISGKALQQVLDISAALNPEDNPGGFLQVSGLRYVIENGRAVEVTIDGKALNPEAEYRVATSDFLAAGGDKYAVLKQQLKEVNETGHRLSDMVIEAFKEQGKVSAKTDGRIQRR